MNPSRLRKLQRRLYNRTPILGGWLRRRAARALVQDGSPEATQVLAEAVTRHEDARVREIAMTALRQLTTVKLIDAACKAWAETRHVELVALLKEKGWVATSPPAVRVLTALKQNREEIITKGAPSLVEPLVDACQDSDLVIAERARNALGRLETVKAQEELCRLVIEREEPIAQSIALESGYLPKESQQKALFFFVTEQWDRYESLDYDRQLLRAAYSLADATVRARVREKLRLVGRTDFLTVIAGEDFRERVADMAAGEFDLLTQTLAANHEWARLWQLLFDVPYTWSVRIVDVLNDSGWQPESGEEKQLLANLNEIVKQGLPVGEQEIATAIPPALLQAQARVPGRINDVTFAPNRPLIAVGTGQRKIALWNYQRGQLERTVSLPNHSVGCVTFVQDDVLAAAERTNQTNVACGLYTWQLDGSVEPVYLGAHNGSITAIASMDHYQLLSTGRDQAAVLWDLHSKTQVVRQGFQFWARAMRLSDDGRKAVLLYRGLYLISLPSLTPLASGASFDVAQSVAFAPDGETLFVGMYNGEVVPYRLENENRLSRTKELLTSTGSRVMGIEVLKERDIVLVASAKGEIGFFSASNRTPIDRVTVPSSDLTSIHISPDGAFMAVGDTASSLSFWDLRMLDMRCLLVEPFARANAQVLAPLSALMDSERLPILARRVFHFAQQVLKHRFRFDIEIGEAPTIMMGEFDIEIE